MAGIQVIVAQIGARRHYAVPVALYGAGRLARLYTDAHAGSFGRFSAPAADGWLRPDRLLRAWRDRDPGGVPRELIVSFPLFALRRTLLRPRSGGRARTVGHWIRMNREFGLKVCGRGFDSAGAVYTFNGAGLEIMDAAKQAGLKCILDQTGAAFEVEESLLREERQRHPGWEIPGPESGAIDEMIQRERREWGLADRIICGSVYVRETLLECGVKDSICSVVPYGILGTSGEAAPERMRAGQFHVLFAGTLCLRKGAPYLLETAKAVASDRIRFRAIGTIAVTPGAEKEIRRHIEVLGPVPRSEVPRHMAWADVLVFPSISEGSANVCYEAMAAGIPVITTPNAGSVVRHGLDGFVVPIRDVAGIVDGIKRLASDPALCSEMGNSARDYVRTFTIERYGRELLSAMGLDNSRQKGGE